MGIHCKDFFKSLYYDRVLKVNNGDNVDEYFEKPLFGPPWDVFNSNWA